MTLLAWITQATLGKNEQLPRHLLDEFPELGQVRWRRGGIAPRIAGLLLGRRSVAGITLWRTVFLGRHAPLSVELLLHELRHVQQFEASRLFPVQYLWETVKSGYFRNRFERDAREFAAARLIAKAPRSGDS
jgi:hypothetical protein